MQNTRICISIKIESIFWLSMLKKDKHISSIIIEVDNAKIANILIEKRPVLNYILHRYIKYNLACKIKQYFNCYKYGNISVHCQKNIKYGACLSLYRTLKYFQDNM